MTVSVNWKTVMNVGPGCIYVADAPHDVLDRIQTGREVGVPFVQFEQVQAHPDGIDDNITVPVWVDPAVIYSIHAKPAEHS